MSRARVVLNQLNIVSGDVPASLAFYRRLGIELPEARAWTTASGTHHASAAETATSDGFGFDLDSAAFAQFWNEGWRGRDDLRGRVVVGFHVGSRAEVDTIYADMTGAGYRGLQPPWDAFWGARYAIIEDPDGIAVGLMSPVSTDKRSPPPEV